MVTSYPVSQQQQSGYYLNNLVTTAEYLMAHGYTAEAASGIAADMAGESSGSPEAVGSGGAGLIGWTPPSKAAPNQPITTGNWQADFNAQLPDVLYYNNQQGSAALQSLNAEPDPVSAADYYSSEFERPLVLHSDVRPDVARYVYNSVRGLPTKGILGQGSTPNDKNTNPQQATLTSFNPLNPLSWFSAFSASSDYLQRFGLIIFGGAIVLIGIWLLAGKQTIKIATTAVAPEAAAAGSAANAADTEGT